MYPRIDFRLISRISLALILMPSIAVALNCTTQKQAICKDDVCQFSKVGDDPLSFSFPGRGMSSSKGKRLVVSFGEGSQSGPLTLIESPDTIAVISLLGPVRQGGKSLGGGNELFMAQIDKKSKTFFVKRSAELLTGSCD
jgi:hypothetical protein